MTYYPNRTACAVLDEIRSLWKTRNFAPLMGLVEELQSMFNRMESALYDKGDLDKARKELSEIKKEIKVLKEKRDFLKDE